MRNCDYYKTAKELSDTFRAYCQEVKEDKCENCVFCGDTIYECVLNFAYAEYDEHFLDKLILKPCANCGGTAVLRKVADSNKYWVECEQCRIQTAFGAKDEVIEKWNRRTEK